MGLQDFCTLDVPLQNALHTEPSSPKIQTSYNLSKAGFAHRDSRSGERNESPGSNLLLMGLACTAHVHAVLFQLAGPGSL